MEIDIDVELGGTIAFAVTATSTNVTILQGAGRLAGWSLRDLSSAVPISKRGTAAAPAAGATIATTGALAAGTYTVNWSVELDGAPAAADENNFQLFNGASPVVISINPGVAGVYPQPPSEIIVTAGNTVSIKSVGAATAGVNYTANLTLTPVAVDDAVVEFVDGNNPIGETSLGALRYDTEWFGTAGPKIQQTLTMNVVSGSVVGAVYIIPSRGSQ